VEIEGFHDFGNGDNDQPPGATGLLSWLMNEQTEERTMRILLLAAVSAATLGLAVPASAAVSVVPACSNSDIAPAAQDCVGFDRGNLLNSDKLEEQKAALKELGFDWDGVTATKLTDLAGTKTLDFSTTLVGINFIGVHFGGGTGGPGVQSTAFYRLDAGTGLTSIALNLNASSNAVLYSVASAAVPEPATWAMFLMGFGAVGYSMRSRKVGCKTLQAV
jgi:hypothetical protein